MSRVRQLGIVVTVVAILASFYAGNSLPLTNMGYAVQAISGPNGFTSGTWKTLSSNTVEFFAGQHTGVTGANQNAKQNFPTRTFALAETGADIVDAYIEIGGQIGASVATTYNSATIYFDMCATSGCTPATTPMLTTATLGTHSGESQYVRLLAPVTNEADIAAYTGSGQTRNFQVGYCFSTASSCTGATSPQLFGATSRLVVTYTYKPWSVNRTGTVRYPLESSSGVGSLPTPVSGNCTIDSNCPKFSYNAQIPEITSQLDQRFDVSSYLVSNTGSAFSLAGQVDGWATGPPTYWSDDQGDNLGELDASFPDLSGYSNNVAQQLEVDTGVDQEAGILGGENVVTYTYPAAAATKTKTVSYPVGEVTTVNPGTGAKSALVGSTVFLPETGRTIRKAWFRIHLSTQSTDGTDTMAITTKVGSRAETAARSYTMDADTNAVTAEGASLVHVIPAADYTELEAADHANGKLVQMSADWDSSGGGAVSAELFITYAYTGQDNGALTTQRLYAGQQVSAPDATFSTAAGAVDPVLSTWPTTIRGATLITYASGMPASSEVVLGSGLTTGSCSATPSSESSAYSEKTRTKFLKNVTAAVSANEADTYTACYASNTAQLFAGVLVLTFQN